MSELITWTQTTYVIQHVGQVGQWYDFATFNINPIDFNWEDERIRDHVKSTMPEGKPWRLIQREAKETILKNKE